MRLTLLICSLVLLVHAGSASADNLALLATGATATSNGDYDHPVEGLQIPDHAIDGNPSTHWDGLESQGTQILTVHLGGHHVVDGLAITESDDDSWITEATISYHNGYAWYPLTTLSKSEASATLSFDPVLAEQIRLEITAVDAPATWTNKVALIYEFAVFGEDFPDARNIASNGTAFANGVFTHWEYGPMNASHAIDGLATTHWDGLEDAPAQVLTIALDQMYLVDQIRIWENKHDAFFTNGEIEYNDGLDWVSLESISKSVPGWDTAFSEIPCYGIRLNISAVDVPAGWYNEVALIYEVEILGHAAGSSENVALVSRGAMAYSNGDYDHPQAGPQVADHAIDGDSETHWDGLESEGVQTLTVGFDTTHLIDQVVIVESADDSWVTEGQLSYHNGYAWYPLAPITKTQAGFDLAFTETLADSIRLEITDVDAPGGWTNKVALIYALEVMGRDWPDPLNAGVGAFARANGEFEHAVAGTMFAHHAVDGDPMTHWDGLEATGLQVLTIGFDRSATIDQIRMWENKHDAFSTDLEFSYHNGLNWHPLLQITKAEASLNQSFAPVWCDSIRLEISQVDVPASWSNAVAPIYELELLSSGARISTPVEETAPRPVMWAQAAPNPFNPLTTVSFSMPVAGKAIISVYDLRGRLVAELANRHFGEGVQSVSWNGQDATGSPISSGVYLYRVSTVEGVVTGKISLVK